MAQGRYDVVRSYQLVYIYSREEQSDTIPYTDKPSCIPINLNMKFSTFASSLLLATAVSAKRYGIGVSDLAFFSP
jgi:hypothetical protein